MSAVTLKTSPAGTEAGRAPIAGRWLWPVVVVLVMLFAALAFAARTVPYFPIDLQAARAVQGVRAPWFHTLMFAVSWPGFPPQVYVFVVIVSIGLYATHQRREALYLLVSCVAIASLSQGVKLLVDRPRPSPALIHVLIPDLNGGHWSFPAGHVESYVVIFGFIAYLASTAWRRHVVRSLVIIICLGMIALIGVSRIDSGEHWLSDAAGGYLMGSAFLLAMLAWYQRGRRLPGGPLGGPARADPNNGTRE